MIGRVLAVQHERLLVGRLVGLARALRIDAQVAIGAVADRRRRLTGEVEPQRDRVESELILPGGKRDAHPDGTRVTHQCVAYGDDAVRSERKGPEHGGCRVRLIDRERVEHVVAHEQRDGAARGEGRILPREDQQAGERHALGGASTVVAAAGEQQERACRDPGAARDYEAMRLLLLVALALVAPVASAAQTWNSDSALALVARAIALRSHAAADSSLRDYKAQAHGFLFFLGQLGEGLGEPPRLVKADQLELEVYWKAPGASKQRIVGWRDRAELPTDINYHRDHLGIVQNGFGKSIRLGDGDEV